MGETGQRQRPAAAALSETAERCLLLRDLPEPDVAAVRAAGRVLRRTRGQTLLRRGEQAALIMLSGAAKEHRRPPHAEDAVLGLLGPGDVAGLCDAVGAPGDGDITALSPAKALLIPGDRLRLLARARPAVALAWLLTTTNQLGALRSQVLDFSCTSTSERLVHRLVELAERFGEPCDEGIRIRTQLTQEELGSWAGISRESAAKALSKLRGAGIVMTQRRSLTILDLEELRRRRRTPMAIEAPPTVMIDLVGRDYSGDTVAPA